MGKFATPVAWGLIVLSGIALGWYFNAAHFFLLGDGMRSLVTALSFSPGHYREDIVPMSLRVFEIFIIVQLIASAAVLGLVHRRLVAKAERRLLIRLPVLLLPAVFALTAVVAMWMTHAGLIGPDGVPDLAEGESAVIGGIRFTGTAFGVGMESLFDSSSALELVWHSVIRTRVDHAVFLYIAIASWFAVAVVACLDYIGSMRREVMSE